MENFQESLAIIREKEHKRKKEIEFKQWTENYEDHLQAMYQMISLYYQVDYNNFIKAIYKTRKGI